MSWRDTAGLAVAGSPHDSVVIAALSGYAAGFVALFVWTWLLYRRHGIASAPRAAVPAACMGGALGGLLTLALASAARI